MTRAQAYKARIDRARVVLNNLGVIDQITLAIDRLDAVVEIDVSDYREENLRLIKRAAHILGYDLREYDEEFTESKKLIIDFSTID